MTAQASEVLRLSDLHVWMAPEDRPEVHAVRGVSLSVVEGERLGIVGESGCGKSTAVLAAMGLLPPSAVASGLVEIGGSEVLQRGEGGFREYRWRDISMVFQGAMSALNPVQRVGRQIVEPLEFHGVAKGRAARNRAYELLELVGLPADYFGRYPHELSGGTRQRVLIAMALVCSPKILIADEPTTALDALVEKHILQLLRQLCEEQGIALIMVSHDLAALERVCSQIVVMYAGKVVERGPFNVVRRAPRHPYTKLLFAASPHLDSQALPASIPGAPPRLDQPIRGCSFAPRCDRVFARCWEAEPALASLAPNHDAACFLYEGS